MKSNDILHRIEAIASSDTDDFLALVKISGLNPKTDFVNADLRGIDLRKINLKSFRLEGCLISAGALSKRKLKQFGAVETYPALPKAGKETEKRYEQISKRRRHVLRAVTEYLNHTIPRRRGTRNLDFSPYLDISNKAAFIDKELKIKIIITLSKRYSGPSNRMWFAYHPSWQNFLSAPGKGYIVLADLADGQFGYAIPQEALQKRLQEFSTSKRPNGVKYWHLHIGTTKDGDTRIKFARKESGFSIDSYKFSI